MYTLHITEEDNEIEMRDKNIMVGKNQYFPRKTSSHQKCTKMWHQNNPFNCFFHWTNTEHHNNLTICLPYAAPPPPPRSVEFCRARQGEKPYAYENKYSSTSHSFCPRLTWHNLGESSFFSVFFFGHLLLSSYWLKLVSSLGFLYFFVNIKPFYIQSN